MGDTSYVIVTYTILTLVTYTILALPLKCKPTVRHVSYASLIGHKPRQLSVEENEFSHNAICCPFELFYTVSGKKKVPLYFLP